MEKKDKINEFLKAKCIAISGVSRDKNKFGYLVYKSFIEKGINVIPINPNIENIDGVAVFSSVSNLPLDVDAIVILNNRNRSQEIIDQAISKRIKNIWIQQKSDPVGFNESSINTFHNIITGECILMWLEPVKGFHKFHRFLKFMFSKN
jgi:uncharacterized protein